MYGPWSDELCKDGHVFSWTANKSFDEPPEGMPCECGLTTAHYEDYPSHGVRTLNARPVNEPLEER